MLRMLAGLLLAAAAVLAQNDVRPAIVNVYTTSQGADYSQPWQRSRQQHCTGSGCIIAGHRVLTNAHVVSDQTFVQVRRAGMADKYVATVLAVCHELDLALLGVADEAFFAGVTPLALGELPTVGDAVTAYGFPVGGTRITITEGVVSRIDRSYYSHSGFANLVCQIDAAINPGSSGGPVLCHGAIAGVAFQADSGQNIGYMVPAPVVAHFLTDMEDGRVDGTPALPMRRQVLENPELRRHYGMADGQSGILLTCVAPRFEGPGMLQAGDVLLAIDGADIANDGTIEFRAGERIGAEYALDRKQVGDAVRLDVLRGGQRLEVKLDLPVAKGDYCWLIPRYQYERKPSYYIVGGLVFSPLTANYFAANNVPLALQRYWYEMRSAKNAAREQVVVLVDVLPDKLNVGYAGFADSAVAEVNGRKVNCLRDVVEAIESHDGPDHRILFEDDGGEIVLPRADLARRSAAILARYGVPADRSPDLRP